MPRYAGEILYRYSLSNDKMVVREAVVLEQCIGRGKRHYIEVKGDNWKNRTLAPSNPYLGVLDSHGRGLWLKERDDEFAKNVFIRYRMELIADLEDQLSKQQEKLRKLMEES